MNHQQHSTHGYLHPDPAADPLEAYFAPFRKNIIGQDINVPTPYGMRPLVYADWTASGRLYRPIEEKITATFGPYLGNTHTETNLTGTSMTIAYHHAREIIKKHVNAAPTDCLIVYGSGMTGCVNKFQRILGLRLPEGFARQVQLQEHQRPVVFITHMEHHSNQTSWLETICDVEVIGHTKAGLVDLDDLDRLLAQYAHRERKYAAVTACSNVTGIATPYHAIAKKMHLAGGLCFVDFACSGPYVHINMHPDDPLEHLDAIYFSPHKFLGGPGTSGILIFNSHLYHNRVPDNPGGGTVKWTNPWKQHDYLDDIEAREDGGTPPFLQTIKTALCIQLKEAMGVDNILAREEHLLTILFERLQQIPSLRILAGHIQHRLGVVSFLIQDLHYNLCVRLLNDWFGIQVRGGCSCAGTYGHYLLEVDRQLSEQLTAEISRGILVHKPGWVRLSIHPTMTDDEIHYICNALELVARYHRQWAADYQYNPTTNDFVHKDFNQNWKKEVESWFDLG